MPSLTLITKLFAPAEGPCQPVQLQWRLIRKKGRPFLLLPKTANEARVGLGLYSAQRPSAKLGHLFLRFTLGTPLWNLVPQVRLQVDSESELVAFIREQSAVPSSQFQSLAILFSCLAIEKQRLLILICNEKARPMRIIKVGLKPKASEVVEREADYITRLPPNIVGSITVSGRASTPVLSAFSMPYCPGDNPPSDQAVSPILRSWLNRGPRRPIKSLKAWQELQAAGGESKDFQILNDILAGQTVQPVIQHGDFTPWNIRLDVAGEWRVFDWECGDLEGMPGWDWFHFVVQTSILVKRHSPQRAAAEVEQLISALQFQDYAEATGIREFARPLLLAYLLRQLWLVKPEAGAATTTALHKLLSNRWRLTEQFPANGMEGTRLLKNPTLTSSL